MLTYELAWELATPLAQVAEILPFPPHAAILDAGGPWLGVVVHRGRSIAIACLSHVLGLDPAVLTAGAYLLVVRCGEHWVGFAVPRLRAIEPVQWTPDPAADDSPAGRPGPLQTRTLARVGSGEGERMLRVVDLQRLAGSLGAGSPAVV